MVSKLLTGIKNTVLKRCRATNLPNSQVIPTPQINEDNVLIDVVAAGVNRKDLPQFEEGTGTNVGISLGLECSGTIVAVGRNVTKWQAGDEVCAILDGGGYAKQVVVPATHVLRRPKNVSLEDSASLPHVTCSIWFALFKNSMQHRIIFPTLPMILIHEGASDIGIMAIQIAKYKGWKVVATEGSDEKVAFCKKLGADIVINNTTEDYVAVVREITSEKGVDIVLGHDVTHLHLDCICVGGKLILVDFHGEQRTVIGLAGFFMSCVSFEVINLRTKSVDCKSSIVAEVERELWPAIEKGKINPVIYSCMDVEEAPKAHEILGKRKNLGKILLRL